MPTGGGGARGPQLCPPAAPHFTRMAAGTHAVGSCGVANKLQLANYINFQLYILVALS